MRWNLLLAGLATSWGFVSVIVAAVDASPLALVFWRCALASTSAALLLLALGRLGSLRIEAHRLLVLALGALLAAHWLFYFAAIKRSSVAVAILTVYTAPIFVAAVAPRLLPERRSGVGLVALAISLPGLVLIALAGEGGARPDAAAVAFGLGAAVTYAALIVGVKSVTAAVSPLVLAFWQYVLVGLALAPVYAFAASDLPVAADWPYILLLGIVFTGLTGAVYFWNLRHVTAQTAGLLAYLEPVSAALLAWALLAQPLGWQVLVGGAAVLGGGLLVVLRAEPEPEPRGTPATTPGS